MRKRLIAEVGQATPPATENWNEAQDVAEVEVTSEDSSHPVESALIPGEAGGWRAATPGKQKIRLLFAPPQRLRLIRLCFVETSATRTQEYVLRWSADGGNSFRELVRQQWNFSPQASNSETEEHRVDLPGATVLELTITPDIGNEDAIASLAQLRLA